MCYERWQSECGLNVVFILICIAVFHLFWHESAFNSHQWKILKLYSRFEHCQINFKEHYLLAIILFSSINRIAINVMHFKFSNQRGGSKAVLSVLHDLKLVFKRDTKNEQHANHFRRSSAYDVLHFQIEFSLSL